MILDLSEPIKLLPSNSEIKNNNNKNNNNNNNKPSITIKLSEELLNQLINLNKLNNLNKFKINLNNSDSPVSNFSI